MSVANQNEPLLCFKQQLEIVGILTGYTLASVQAQEVATIRQYLSQMINTVKRHCWFCHQPLRRKDHVNRHHVIAFRYPQGIASPLVFAHEGCHNQWNLLYDHSSMDWVSYVQSMQKLEWGFGIFA
jgi:hypothetical protein